MKVKVKDNAKDYYVRRTIHNGLVNWKWAETLEKVQGQTLEVETEWLFRDQFNTAPIPGISENGLRLMAADVSEVIDDMRPGKFFCRYCHHWGENGEFCPHCLQTLYLEPF